MEERKKVAVDVEMLLETLAAQEKSKIALSHLYWDMDNIMSKRLVAEAVVCRTVIEMIIDPELLQKIHDIYME